MSMVMGAPSGAKDARQVKRVARAVLALAVAVGVMGCDNPAWVKEASDKRLFRTEDGCLWDIEGSFSAGGWIWSLRKITPRLTTEGKPMCGEP